ncbi:MAG: phosphoglycerate mutase family protein [Pseudomonadota bacterium]
MPRIFMLRHGNTFDRGDIVRRVGGRTDLPLSPSGREQLFGLTRALKARNAQFTTIFSSPLKRTLETAEYVRDAICPMATIDRVEALKEIDYGPDENCSEEMVITRIGRAAIDRWDQEAIPPEGWRVDTRALIIGWRKIFKDASNLPGDVLIVTSNGVARFALNAADRVEAGLGRKLRTAAFGVAEVTSDGHTSILEWNVRS